MGILRQVVEQRFQFENPGLVSFKLTSLQFEFYTLSLRSNQQCHPPRQNEMGSMSPSSFYGQKSIKGRRKKCKS